MQRPRNLKTWWAKLLHYMSSVSFWLVELGSDGLKTAITLQIKVKKMVKMEENAHGMRQ